ncbi:MAG: hypothetical protein BroJett038_19920 [Chloroflexota bacterium]|nr:MAG: hypothetical protein BroJett038_19920 [Chloroflexota bacterium]
MKLPNREKAVVPRPKIVHYLLDLSSENGRAKARFFLTFGFTIETWEVMAQALRQHAHDHEVTRIEKRPPFGIHYVIEGTLNTPDGRNPAVRVIWIIDEDDDIPRLVSAYPM